MKKILATLFTLSICTAALLTIGCGKNQDNHNDSAPTKNPSIDRETGIDWDEEIWG